MRRPSDEPTAWLVRAEGGHSEGRGPRGSLPVCRGQLPWQARIRPGMGPPSWPAAEWGPGGASSRGQLRGSAVPAEAEAGMLVAARVSGQHENPCGAPGRGARRPLQGRRGARFRGAARAHSACPQLPHGSVLRVAAGSGWALRRQPPAVSRA